MEYVIYTVGNAEFLGAIFNGVAAITTSENFTTLISIGLLFGILYTCWECVMNGTRAFNLQHMLVALCAYLCMFGPTRTVIVQDVYNVGTGDVVVDNIPLGVAASGSIVSRIGYGICVLIETAYQPANAVATVHQGGFAEPLRLLNHVRNFDYGPAVIEAMNKKLGTYKPYGSTKTVEADIRQAFMNYIRDCTYPEIQMNHTSIDKIKMTPDASDPFKSPSTAYHVYLPIPSDSGGTDPQTFSCAEGYAVLKKVYEETFESEETKVAIADSLGGSLIKSGNKTIDPLSDGMRELGLVGQNAQLITKNRIINTVLSPAAAGHFKTIQDQATAIATMSAIDQRNIQWASEGTMFTQSMHALMTFIEGFCYAIMPIMAFVFVMGALGMRIVGKYFQIILWIQLWYPIMAIINLYIISSTKTALKPYATTTSFYDIGMMFREVENHLGVAGLMLGATPLLALLIITGSSMAFTAIAGRMGGQDHFNEKQIQSDALSVGAAMNMSSLANTNYGQGTMMAGTESLIPTLNVRQAQEGAVQVAESRSIEKASGVSRNLVKELSSGATNSLATSTARNIGASLQAQDSQAYNTVASMARKMGWGTGKDGAVTHEDVGRLVASAQAGFRIKIPGLELLKLGVGTEGSLTTQGGQKLSFTAKEDISKEEATAFNKLNSATLTSAVTAGTSKTVTEADSLTKNEIDKTTLGKSMTESVKASETLSKTRNALNSMGTSYNSQLNAVTKAGLDNFFKEDSRRVMWMNQAYNDALNDNSLSASTRTALLNAERNFRKFGANDLQAKAMAYMTLASNVENGRIGDFTVLANAAGIAGYVGGADFNTNIPTPEAVGDVSSVTGYTGGPVKPGVVSSIKQGQKDVTPATTATTQTLNDTGGNATTAFDKGKNRVTGENQKNVREQLLKQLNVAEGKLQSFSMPTVTKVEGATGSRTDFDKDAQKYAGLLTAGQLSYLKASRGGSSYDLDVSEEAEQALYSSVENQYKELLGDKFDEKQDRARIDKSYTKMKEILDTAQINTEASLSELVSFNRSIRK